MKLTNLLIKMGLLAGTPEPVVPEKPAPPKPVHTKRVLSLKDLQTQSRSHGFRPDLPLDQPLEALYKQAGLPENHLESLVEQVAGLEPAEALKKLLELSGKSLEELLDEAQRKDATLDAYELQLVAEVGGWTEKARKKVEVMRAEAQRILAEAQELENSIPAAQVDLEKWCARKRAAEEKLEAWARKLLVAVEDTRKAPPPAPPAPASPAEDPPAHSGEVPVL